MPAEAPDIDAAALSYESELRLAFDARGSEPPAFDLIWLGMGPDGHTASLFPGTLALEEAERWVVGNWVPHMDAWRMTLTFPVLNAGKRVIFAVTGADKADALRAIRAGGSGLPAERGRGPSTSSGSSTPPPPASAARLTDAAAGLAGRRARRRSRRYRRFGWPAWQLVPRARVARPQHRALPRLARAQRARAAGTDARGDDRRGAPPDLRCRGARRRRASSRSSPSS